MIKVEKYSWKMPDIDQKKIEKWMRDNPSLELSLWLETEKHNLKITSLFKKYV